MPIVDLSFSLQGQSIPADHGYELYSALCRFVPSLHDDQSIGIHPISGILVGGRMLALTDSSHLTIRVPHERISDLMRLAGKRIELAENPFRIGTPRTFRLRPESNLWSRLVVIKGFMEPDGFLDAANRQLEELSVSGSLSLVKRKTRTPLERKVGSQEKGSDEDPAPIRRTLRIKDKEVVGFALQAEGLSEEDSIRLQEVGIGGRRRMGCGVFVPTREE